MFSHYQSPEANHSGWPDVSANVDLCVAKWYSLSREIVGVAIVTALSFE